VMTIKLGKGENKILNKWLVCFGVFILNNRRDTNLKAIHMYEIDIVSMAKPRFSGSKDKEFVEQNNLFCC
jgi:hypothetical protein